MDNPLTSIIEQVRQEARNEAWKRASEVSWDEAYFSGFEDGYEKRGFDFLSFFMGLGLSSFVALVFVF